MGSHAEQHVIAAVIQRGNCYLICKRPPHKRHGNLWEFPGGKLEPGESFEEAAQRELSEELGMRVVSLGGLRLSIVDEASGFTINFVEVVAEGEPQLFEHTEIQWCHVSELMHMALAPSDLTFVRSLSADVG